MVPIYAKKVQSSNSRFEGREIAISTFDNKADIHIVENKIPVPNNVVLCNGCNKNIVEMEKPEGYLIYLGNRELQQDRPYDIYCSSCLKKYFSKVVIVE